MRALTDVERSILARMMAVDFEGVERLRIQAQHVLGAVPNCQCGCPSITLRVDRNLAPSAASRSPLPAELQELRRPDGIPRTVLCFLDDAGYLDNLECVYYDEPRPDWPPPQDCAVLVRGDHHHVAAAGLPSGTAHPADPQDPWLSVDFHAEGISATTRDGYRDSFDTSGILIDRVRIR